MKDFRVDTSALGQLGNRVSHETGEGQRSIADQVQSGTQTQLRLGDFAAVAEFSQAWYSWGQTRFEDLQATEDALSNLGRDLSDAAQRYAEDDLNASEELRNIGAILGGGAI